MISLRKFNHDDAESVRRNLYPDMTLQDVLELIDKWNTCVYHERYFEAFAIFLDAMHRCGHVVMSAVGVQTNGDKKGSSELSVEHFS